MKFWITFAERYGMPWPVGKLPRNSSDADFQKMLDNLEAMVTDAMAVIPNDATIEFLESGSKSASADIYEGMVAWANAEMSKAIVGHSGAADSTPGKLGGEDNAMDVRADLIAEDKLMVEEQFNILIDWICKVNFGDVESPKFYLYEEQDIDLDTATRDKTLYDQGVRMSPEYFERTYGFQKGDILEVKKDEPAPVPGEVEGQPGAFAESKKALFEDQAAVDKGIDAATKAEDLRREAGFAQQIMDAFAEAGDYSEAMEKAIGLYPNLDTKATREKVHQAIFLAGVVGRLSAQEGA
jgi:phage gp29-like protein